MGRQANNYYRLLKNGLDTRRNADGDIIIEREKPNAIQRQPTVKREEVRNSPMCMWSDCGIVPL